MLIAERMFDIADLLRALVPLARDEQGVAGVQELKALFNGPAAIRIGKHFGGTGEAGHDVGHDRLRLLVARIVGGKHGHVGQPGHGFAHERALGAVAVAPAAEHGDDTLEARPTQRVEDVDQRVGRMRIVHKDIEILRIEDALQTARHAAERFETTERFGIEAEPEGDGLHGKQIFRIVLAYQRRREFPFAAFKTSVQAQSGGRTGKDFPLKVAPGGTGGRQAKTDGFGGHARQTGPPRIIRADGHHAIRERFAVPIKEQLGLCLEIRFHIVMVVKVILRQVREHGPAEADARDAVLIQRVRRNFHEGHVHTGGAHVGQHSVHIEAIRSGHGRVLMMPRPAIGNRTEHAGLLPGGGEQMIEQIGRGGLAVGPGHADHGERERGRAVPGAGQQPKGLPGIGTVDDFRFAAVPGGFGTGKTMTQHQIAKWSDADIIIYIGCGERGNEMTQVLEDFSKLIDPKSGNLMMDRTTLIANTSNMPVAAREASIYTGVTLAEYYRDMGYDVAIMADSTSRWAEALRELSGRLEEMPAEEGFPAYLASKLSAFYERAGMMQNLNGTEGSVSIIGAVSPQGGDFSEPVTQNTKRFVRCFWGLDKALAYARHFPAIQWLTSYSEYLEDLTPWYREHVSPKFVYDRNQIMAILNQESSLMEIVKLIGSDVLPDDQKLTLEIARVIRLGFLQQNAFHQEDTSVPMEKQFLMMETILYLYEKCRALVNRGMPVSVLKEDKIFERIIAIKYEVPNKEPERFDEYHKDIDRFYDNVLERNG